MKAVLDAFWRAAAYCVLPRVVALTLAPLLLGALLAFGLGWFFWEPAVDAVRVALEGQRLAALALGWLERLGGASLRALVAPILVVVAAVPLVVVVSLLLVALLATPALVRLVAARRFADLERKRGGSLLAGLAWSLGCTILALVALVLSVPLWFVPPLVLVLPPLIWGWLTWQVFAFDALAEHASVAERREINRRHRLAMFVMGVACGLLGAAPALLWTLGALAFVFAPLLIVASVWLYTLVFAFSALWFAHFALAALACLRREDAPPPAAVVAPAELPALPLT